MAISPGTRGEHGNQGIKELEERSAVKDGLRLLSP